MDDADAYAAYRAGMTPILARFEGAFVLDLWVAEVLKAPTEAPFNRVFTIRFPSADAMDAFFADHAYLAVRAQFFARSVSSVTELTRRG